MKKPNIQIRAAVPDDAPLISSVLYESFVAYKSSYTPEGFAATTPTSDQIQSRMTEGPVWVVLRDQAIVGTASAVLQGESLYVRGMAVLPNARGQKIGELLLAHIESFASANGVTRLFLSTTPFLSSAIRLYERFGFQRTDEAPHNLFGTPIFTMEKLLKARRKEMKDPSNTEDTREADSTTLDYSKLESVVGRLADAILQSKEPPPDDKGTLQADYQITVDMVKAFSDIRFRCLVFVTAIITVASALLPGTGDPGTRIALGLVGFLATLGIAVYELRNSQLYEAAIHRATILETKLASLRATEHSKQGGLFNERPPYVDDKIWKSLLPEQQTALKKSKRVPFMSFWFVKVKHDFGLAIIYGAALAGWVYIVASGLRTFLLFEGFWSATVHDLIRRLPAVIALLAFAYSVSRFVHHDKNRFRPEPPKKTHAKRSEPESLAPSEVGRSQ